MADFENFQGPFKIIRPSVTANKTRGQAELVNATYGFWMQNLVAADVDTGSFCIEAAYASIARTLFDTAEQTGAYSAGAAVYYDRSSSSLKIHSNDKNSRDSGTPGVVGIIYSDVASTDTRIGIVFEHH